MLGLPGAVERGGWKREHVEGGVTMPQPQALFTKLEMPAEATAS
jgi:hypothetical protein